MKLIGTCGDNCFYCPRHIATKSENIEELEKVKQLWVRLGLRVPDFPVKNIVCYGCKPENKCAYMDLQTCVTKKGIENCGLCDDYSCELINNTFDQSEKLRSYANRVCTLEEIEMLNMAFFSKKDYFDKVHQKHQKK